MTRNVSVRLDEEFVQQVDELADIENIDRSQLLRKILKDGLEEHRFELAVKQFAEDEMTVSEAASLAGVPVGKFMDKLVDRGIQADVSVKELDNSLEHARTQITEE